MKLNWANEFGDNNPVGDLVDDTQPHVSPMLSQVLRQVYWDADYEGGSTRRHLWFDHYRNGFPNCISSQVRGPLDDGSPSMETHKVVLDIDFPVKAIPSSTEGHYHLYIDKEMKWADYVKLITTMAEVGLLESGYVRASIARGETAVRLPWIKKGSVNE